MKAYAVTDVNELYVYECVILPDYVACLRKAASHKEAFDDVDFLIHGLRQAEGN